MRYLHLAWRNLLRKRRRTAITMAAVSLNTAVLIFTYSMMDGMLVQAVGNATRLAVGEVQIHAPGYLAERSLHLAIPEAAALLERARAAGLGASARSYGFGLVSRATKSAGASFWGVAPEEEQRQFRLPTRIQAGRFLAAQPQSSVVIGCKLARSLQARVGSELVAVVQAADGSLGNELFRVAGVLQAVGEETDRGAVLLHAADFERLFVSDGRIHEIALTSHGRLAPEQIAARYADVGPGVEVKTWRQLLPMLSDMVNMTDAAMAVFSLVFFLAAALGVLNTMLMATHDRVREFGMLKALGTRPALIVRDVLVEALLLALVAALLGSLLGGGVSYYFEVSGGMDLTRWQGGPLTMGGIPFEAVYEFVLSGRRVLSAVLAMCLMCVLASLYPALKAARLDPVRAMSQV